MASENKEPRQLEEINKEYTSVCAQVGQQQYQIEILSREVKTKMDILVRLSVEANKRNELNATTQTSEASGG